MLNVDEKVGTKVDVSEGSLEGDFQVPLRLSVTESDTEVSRENVIVGVGVFDSEGDGSNVGLDEFVADDVIVTECESENSLVEVTFDKVRELDSDTLVVSEADGKGDEETDKDGDLDNETSSEKDSVGVGVNVAEAVAERDEERESSTVSERLVSEAESVTDDVAEAVSEMLLVLDELAVSSDRLSSSVKEGESVTVAVAVSD